MRFEEYCTPMIEIQMEHKIDNEAESGIYTVLSFLWMLSSCQEIKGVADMDPKF